jgi:sugar phosphate isomerase/epimerase
LMDNLCSMRFTHRLPQIPCRWKWIRAGSGQDVMKYIAEYAGRLPLVHLKDYRKGEQGELITLELGNGTLPLLEIIAASEKAGTEWIIVEQDRCQKPQLESVQTSINWLKNNYLVQL